MLPPKTLFERMSEAQRLEPETVEHLLGDVAQLLRGYEAHHRAKAEQIEAMPGSEALEKAERNARMAERVEAMLARLLDFGEGNRNCLAKRRPGEPMFILLGRDPDAAEIVRLWASRRCAAGGDIDHCNSADEIADTMDRYRLVPANWPASAPPKEAYGAITGDPLAALREAVKGCALIESGTGWVKVHGLREYGQADKLFRLLEAAKIAGERA